MNETITKMLFSTATVLSTLAVAGNVAASNLHHGHAQFHNAKRQSYVQTQCNLKTKS